MIGVKFGSLNLQANGIVVTSTDVYSAPSNNIQVDDMAERDGALIVQQRYKSKSFKIEGLLRADSRTAVEQLRDTFITGMSSKNQAFDIDYAGSIRRYLASAENIIISDQSISTMSFTVNLLCPDGVGWDVGSTALIASSNTTAASALVPITVGGTYKAEPTITVVVNTVTGGTTQTITLGNGETLRSMSVTRTWANGDRLEVNTLQGTVFVNGVAADFRGQLPSFAPGVGTFSYLDSFTTRDTTITASYARRWL